MSIQKKTQIAHGNQEGPICSSPGGAGLTKRMARALLLGSPRTEIPEHSKEQSCCSQYRSDDCDFRLRSYHTAWGCQWCSLCGCRLDLSLASGESSHTHCCDKLYNPHGPGLLSLSGRWRALEGCLQSTPGFLCHLGYCRALTPS